MTRLSNLLAFVAITLPSLVAAADETCLFFLPEWECDVCGGYDPSGPIVCAPYNATFDDLAPGKAVGNYKSANWMNFRVAKESTGAPFHINAASLPNYGLVPANHKGNMSFTGTFPFGRLYSMHYACAIGVTDPSSYVAVPTSCEVTVTAKCQPTISEPDPAKETTATYTLTYRPDSELAANMTYAKGFPPEDNGVCTSYAFSAKGFEGRSVDLLVDEVLYNSYSQGFAK